MSFTATWIVTNPTVGQEYIAPAAYQVIPNAGSQVKCNVESHDSSGNLISVTSITTIVRDVTTNHDQMSYTYYNGYGANCTTSQTNGTDVFAPAGKVGSACASLRMWLTYTGKTADLPPNAPNSLEPDGLETTLTPLMQASFSDPTPGDTLNQYEYQVNSAANGGGSQIWDTGTITASSSEKSAAQSSRTYGVGGGSATALTWGGSYSWRARHANNNGNWGPWSGWVNFTTTQGPNQATITAPTGLQAALGPNYTFGYSSPSAVALHSYRYTLTDIQAVGAIVFDSGVIYATVASGGTVNGTIPAGGGQQYGHSYHFNLTVTDANGAVSQVAIGNFTIATLPQCAPLSPARGATVNTHFPTVTWSFSDPNYPQAQAQVEIQNAATDVDLLLTSWLAQSTQQYTSTTSIAYGTQIRWRVQVQDSAGVGSGWSAWAYAVVNNTPAAAITSPTAGAVLATVLPTITWAYTASAGGQLQASAVIALFDGVGNPLTTYTQAGAGTSFTLPIGALANSTSYQVQVSVTDTAAATGQSALTAFSVSLVAPADMQGQPLGANVNFLLDPYVNTDSGTGTALDWSSATDANLTAAFSIDPTVTHVTPGLTLANGDGPVMGAQLVAVTGFTGSGVKHANLEQTVTLANTSMTVGSHLSLSANVIVAIAPGGGGYAYISVKFFNSGGGLISEITGVPTQGDTSGAIVALLGPQAAVIPTGTTSMQVFLRFAATVAADVGSQVWWLDAMLNPSSSSDASFISGDMGTGYSYDGNGYSDRTLVTGGMPNVVANPGQDGDPASASGGSTVVSWDATLADATRFTNYLIERRRMDEQGDDSAWETLATISNAAQNSFTDYTPGSNTTYQYSIRQQIAYPGGLVGLSQNRAIALGSVSFSPAWYLSNAAGSFVTGAQLTNVRLQVLSTQRTLTWKDSAKYSQFIGRVGSARDGGASMGYVHSLVCYYDDAWGDTRPAIRRQFVSMQRQGSLWFLKDPEGLVIPVWLQDVQFGEQDTGSDTLLTVTLNLLQAQDTDDC